MQTKVKDIVIVGTGTAGLMSAAILKAKFGESIRVKVFYDSSKKNIGVGEGTIPGFIEFINNSLKLSTPEFLSKFNSTIKLGILFKNWNKNKDYFHGFITSNATSFNSGDWDRNICTSTYSFLKGNYTGGINFNDANTLIPEDDTFSYNHGIHVDSQDFSNVVTELLKDKVEFIDDVVESVAVENKRIKHITLKKTGAVHADFFIDASGIKKTLIKNLTNTWVDVTDILPIDRAIPQQVFKDFKETPSYTLSEATDCGWIWQIPVRNRYGTGFLYSSKYTTDEEAFEKYDKWLQYNHNEKLNSSNIIKFEPGYYKESWVGNCLAVGLAGGFLEPLEATGIEFIRSTLQIFLFFNPVLDECDLTALTFNKNVSTLYEETCLFLRLHYCTGRDDTPFWRHFINNKPHYIECLEKCSKTNSIFQHHFEGRVNFFRIENYFLVLHGLGLLDRDAMFTSIKKLPNSLNKLKALCKLNKNIEIEKSNIKYRSHKKYLEGLYDSKAVN